MSPSRGGKAGERSLDLLRWGLVPFWAKDLKVGFANINAKAERDRDQARLLRGVPTPPNELCAELHNRMPVVLKPESWPVWLGEESAGPAELKALLAPFPSEEMTRWPVSVRVGNVKNNDPTLIEPIAA